MCVSLRSVERKRERGKKVKSETVCVSERDRETMCVRECTEKVGVKERDRVCVRLFVCLFVCVCVLCLFVCACVCVCVRERRVWCDLRHK